MKASFLAALAAVPVGALTGLHGLSSDTLLWSRRTDALALDGTEMVGDKASSSQQCLWFMHIPKTGGTSIEHVILGIPKEHRPYQCMTAQYLGAHAEVRSTTQSPEEGHTSPICDLPGPEASVNAERFSELDSMFAGDGIGRTTRMPDGQYCQWVHTPPQYNRNVAKQYGGCTTFCAVREPLARLISAYKFWCFGPCSVEQFEAFVELLETRLRQRPYTVGCHFLQQVEFVYGVRSMNTSTHQQCNRVLRYEELEKDYDLLMEEFGSSVRLGDQRVYSTDQCKIDPAAISQKTKDTVYNLYRADYEAFGYARP